MTLVTITYCGQPATVACDTKCEKAWGRNSRPRDEQDNMIPDADLDIAPENPGTSEGDQYKPTDRKINKWCVRECERSAMTAPGCSDAIPVLPKF